MQSLAGAEAMQCLTDRGGNCKSFLNLVSLIVLLDGFAQKVFSVGWFVFFLFCFLYLFLISSSGKLQDFSVHLMTRLLHHLDFIAIFNIKAA